MFVKLLSKKSPIGLAAALALWAAANHAREQMKSSAKRSLRMAALCIGACRGKIGAESTARRREPVSSLTSCNLAFHAYPGCVPADVRVPAVHVERARRGQ